MSHKCAGDEKKLIPEFYICPDCGSEVEIWSDESKRKCPSCHQVVLKDQAKKKQ
ncbi:MAG: hypothetical protein WCQ99_03365 [Pseudomonadota bacterium]